MKAMTVKEPGGLENLVMVDREAPEPGPGQVLVRIRSSSLNYHDYVVATGLLRVEDGRVILSDGAVPHWLAGEASQTSMAVKPGESVDGYGCEYVAVPEAWVTRAPAGYTDADAVILPQ